MAASRNDAGEGAYVRVGDVAEKDYLRGRIAKVIVLRSGKLSRLNVL